MKKLAHLIIITLLPLFTHSQEGGYNEVKLNIYYTFIQFPEITYERIIDNHSAVGTSLSVTTGNNEREIRYMLIPYYRYYCGTEEAKGFFLEANTAFVNQKAEDYNSYKTLTTNNFGLGGALGAKFLFKYGLIFEINAGIGKLIGIEGTIFDTEGPFIGIYPRLGITLGKRF